MGALGAALGLALRSPAAAVITVLVVLLALDPLFAGLSAGRALGAGRRGGRADRQRRGRPPARLGRRPRAAGLRGRARRRWRRRSPPAATSLILTAMLASVDGAIGPAEAGDDPGHGRGPPARRRRVRGHAALRGSPVRARGPLRAARRAPAPGCAWSPTSTRCARRRRRCWSRPGRSKALLRLVLTRGGRRIALIEPLPRHAPIARVATIPTRRTASWTASRRSPTPATCSRRGSPRRVARRGAARHAPRPRPRGPDVVVLLGPRRPRCSRRRSRTGSSARSPARAPRGDRRGRGACTLDDLRGAEEAFIASTVRDVQPIAAIDDLRCPPPRAR